MKKSKRTKEDNLMTESDFPEIKGVRNKYVELRSDIGTSNTQSLIDAWRTNHNVTTYLIKNLPAELWSMNVPGSPRRTVRAILAHIHNARCMWIKMIGARHGTKVPKTVDGRSVSPAELLRALEGSNRGMIQLIKLGAARGGNVPPADWQNFPTDLVHFLSYFVAHEAHHRGQLVMLARQLGYKLPRDVTAGLWQWKKRTKDL